MKRTNQDRQFLTVDEAMPELTVIAKEEGLNLTKTKEFKEAVRIMDMNNLNR